MERLFVFVSDRVRFTKLTKHIYNITVVPYRFSRDDHAISARPQKHQNLKPEMQFQWNVYCFPTVMKLDSQKVVSQGLSDFMTISCILWPENPG